MDMKRQLAMKKARKGGDAGPYPEGPPKGFTEIPPGHAYVDENGNKIFTEYSDGEWEYNYSPIGDPYRNVGDILDDRTGTVAAVTPYGAQRMGVDDYYRTQQRMKSVRPSRLRLMRNASGIAPSKMPMRNTPMRYL